MLNLKLLIAPQISRKCHSERTREESSREYSSQILREYTQNDGLRRRSPPILPLLFFSLLSVLSAANPPTHATDSRGWEATSPAHSWDKRWQDILATGPNSALNRILAAGFDGILADWIDSYTEPRIVAAAKRQGIDPAAKMVELISRIHDEARRLKPSALLIAMNGPYLATEQPKFLEA